MPGPLGIVVPWILSLMVCVLLAGRTLSVTRLSVSVGVTQFLFHVLFVLGTITPSGQVSGHVHGAALALPASLPLSEAAAADASMWVGHAIAAVITVAVLHSGERMLLGLRDLAVRVIRWLRRRLGVVVFAQQPSAPGTQIVTADDGALPSPPFLATLRRRGPPLARMN